MTGPVEGARPLPLSASRRRLELSGDVLVSALTLLAAADRAVDVAHACLPLLLRLPAVRGTAVVQRTGRDVVVVGSAGYGCGVMAAGARLSLDAGLPITEAVRTGRPVSQGTGPGWMAVPFGRGTEVSGGLLVSLDAAPSDDPAEVERFSRLAAGIGAALRRAVARDRADGDLALVMRALMPHDDACRGLDVAVRRHPLDGAVGGDVVACLDDDGAVLLVAADVCGSGLAAAVVAGAVRTAVHTALSRVTGPAELLRTIDSGVRPVVGPDSFVTATAVRLVDGAARVASAGHPVPVLLTADGATPLAVEPAPPLALVEPPAARIAEATWTVPTDGVLLLHTDGLTDRRTSDGVRMLEPSALCAGVDLTSVEHAADAVLAAADAVAPASDDVSVLLARAAVKA